MSRYKLSRTACLLVLYSPISNAVDYRFDVIVSPTSDYFSTPVSAGPKFAALNNPFADSGTLSMIPSQPTAKMSTLCPPENFAPALDQFSLTPPPDWAFFNWTGNASTAQLSVLYPLQANLSLGLYMRAGTGVSYCGNTGRSTGPFSYEAGRLVLTNSLGATIWEDSVNVSGTVTLATCTLPSSLDIDFGNMYTASSGSTIGTATTTFVMQCANIIESLPDVTIDAISKTGDMVTEPERSDYGISLTYDNAPVTLGSPVSRGSTGSHTISARLLQLESKVKAGEINANATITLSYN